MAARSHSVIPSARAVRACSPRCCMRCRTVISTLASRRSASVAAMRWHSPSPEGSDMTTLALAARTPRTRALGVLLCVAALALSAQIAIPLPSTPVPLSFQPFVVVLSGLLLGPLDAAGAMVLYLVLGALGAPVFAPMGPPGIARLLSPTGGYLIAYPLAAAVAGWLGASRPRLAQRALA